MPYFLFFVHIFSFDASDPDSGLGRYANDNWTKPNAVVRLHHIGGNPHLFLKAIRDNVAHTEIPYDYGDPSAPCR